MSNPIEYRGTTDPQEQSYSYEYDPSSGGRRTFGFDTFSEDKAIALANANIANRVPTTYRREHGNCTVIVSDSNFPPIDTWQMLANEVSKSRYDAPNMLRILKYGDDPDFYGKQTSELKNGISNSSPFASIAAGLSPAIVGYDLDYVYNVYNLLLRGSDSYPFSQYCLRHTTNVGNGYSSNIADSNVDCVYTRAQLLTEVLNSGYWVFPLPGEIQFVIQHLSAPSFQTGYLWGWLKRSSTRTTSAFNRVDITTEYWLEQWEQTQLGYV